MKKRTTEEKIFKGVMIVCTCLFVGTLVSILLTIFLKGLPALNWDMITKIPQGGYYLGQGGGILNAILGSLILVSAAVCLALLFSLPLAVYLNLFLSKDSGFALCVRFFMDILWGIPSIVYGAFGFIIMVFLGIKTSLLAGIIAVTLLIIPIMARSMDEALKLVSFELKEAAFALGATRLQVAINVALRQALPGIVTAVLIGFGRAIGDAASVLFTAGFSDNIPYSLLKPVATLPLAIFFQLGTPFASVQQRGYASAFILTIIILVISIIVRVLNKKNI